MPLKLIPPRPGRSPFYTVRGKHLGVPVDRSTKLTDRQKAAKLLAVWREEIERGAFAKPGEPTFLSEALAYIKAGGDSRFLGRYDEASGQWSGLLASLGDMLLRSIDQATIDDTAVALYPDATAATRNRQVYTPVSAILKRAGIEREIKRPTGWRGKKRTVWLRKEQAFALFKAADAIDPEFGLFVRLLCYTGLRLDEALKLTCDLVELPDAFAYIPTTKNEDPRGVYLPPVLLAALANHPRGVDRGQERVFRFRKCGRLYAMLNDACKAAGITLPPRTAFHVFRHTWATWMRRYGGLDRDGLVATGAWRDPASAARYAHVVVSEEARQADLLPVEKNATRTRAKSVERARKQA